MGQGILKSFNSPVKLIGDKAPTINIPTPRITVIEIIVQAKNDTKK
jgi:hypothetical protein